MRRAMAGFALVVLAPSAAACSSDDEKIYHAPANEVVPSSGYFDKPISVAVGDGSMSLTVSPLRLETNATATVPENIAIADVKAVNEFGAPFVEPGQLHIYAPDGTEFQVMKNPDQFLRTPLTHTDLTSPGQEVSGSVAFIVPAGIRIGRVDFVSGTSTVSFTVTRQPANPTTSASGSTSAG